MARRIGVVAVSAEGAALCYRTIALEGDAEVILHNIPFGEYMDLIEENDWDGVAERLRRSVILVAQAGAEVAIIPDNTVHRVFEQVVTESPIPLIHIAEAVAEDALRRNFQTLGLLGTCWTMQSDIYPKVLASRGIQVMTPELADQIAVHRIIFDELIRGIVRPASRDAYVEIIRRLAHRGADAVILGCTEIPLLIDDTVSPIPTLDSTRLLARAALRW